MKHWIQSVLEEDPFIPFAYFYDVVTWSYTLNRGLAGDGTLTQNLPSGTPMTMIGTPALGTFPTTVSPYYAWATDSMTGLGLVVDVLAKGATVTRTGTAFDAGGRHFPTGTALVSAASLSAAGVNLAQLAAARQTPVAGLPNRPVASFPIRKPKIGLYAGAAEPSNPSPAGNATKGHCGGGAGLALTEYCEALFTLKVKDKLPIVAVTDADMPTLLSGGFTALINPGETLVPAGALQAFVNGGGIYVGTGTAGTDTARTGGLTNLDTKSANVTTPGSTFDATFNTADPAAWGFDEGGFVYRESSDDPIYDPATLAGTPPVIANAVAAVSYKSPVHSFGYQVGATAPAALPGTPVVVDQPSGSGRAVLIGFDAFFRAWHESSERLVINGALAPIAASTPAGSKRVAEDAAETPAAEPVAAEALRPVAPRPVTSRSTRARDVRIVVSRGDTAQLKRAVRGARLSRKLRHRLRYERGAGTTTLLVRGVRRLDSDARKTWTGRVMAGLAQRGVRPVSAQL